MNSGVTFKMAGGNGVGCGWGCSCKAHQTDGGYGGDLTINEISSKYGVHSTQINRWKQQAMTAIKSSFTGKRQKQEQSEQQLMDKLYQQIGQLKCENDFLKKSVWE